MYKVFLVEDEVVVRKGIRENVNWSTTNYIFSGEAPDGEIALPLIQEIKPDILITDIKMPFMDGLELSRVVKKSMPWIKILILSGYDEFNFAKEAISIGVTEYLLKPVDSVKLLSALDKIALLIENEKKEKDEIESLKRQVESNNQLYRERFLNELSLGLVSPVEAVEKAAHFNLNIVAKYYLAAIVELEKKSNVTSPSGNSIKYLDLEQLVTKAGVNCTDMICFKRSLSEMVMVFMGDSISALEREANNLAQNIRNELGDCPEYSLSIGIGDIRERIQGISQSFYDADQAKSGRRILGGKTIGGISDAHVNSELQGEYLKLDKNFILDFLKFGKKADVSTFVNRYIDCIQEIALKSSLYAYYAFMDIALIAAKFVNEIGGKAELLIPEINDMERILAETDSFEEFKKNVQRILLTVLDFRDMRKEDKYGKIINDAKEYIQGNIHDPDLSLNAVALHVNLSPNHFSGIFSQEVSETFIEYLTKTRIKRAMELLRTTSQKSSDIAFKVGYNDPHYFSYMFKKVTGITPKEYRNQT